MIFLHRWRTFFLFVVVLGASPAVSAALVDRGGGMIYDTDLNITWMANANVNGGASTSYDAGWISWYDAMTWADNLSYGGYTDWRLPSTVQPDAACSTQSGGNSSGYNCTGSELGHLFYNELGGTAGASIFSSSDPDLALFTNLQSFRYWSSMEYAPDTTYAWSFNFNDGVQTWLDKHVGAYYAWAVRDGDVVSVVPVPASVWLFGSGLLGLIHMARRKAA